MNIGNYHLYADIDDVERKFVIGKKKGKTLHAFRFSEREGQALLTAQERVAGCSDNVRRIFAHAGCLQKHGFVAYYEPTAPSAFSINPL